jgi:hypothetical protein
MADLVDRLVNELQRRADELAPLAAEHQQITAAVDALHREGLIVARKRAPRIGGLTQGTKAHQRVLRAVSRTPGLNASELAYRLKISRAYVSSLTADLRRWDSLVRVDRRFYLPSDEPGDDQ